MTTFASRCGVDVAERRLAVQRCLQRLRDHEIDEVRVVWPDVHGTLRGKALTPAAAASALDDGVGLVSTLLLKDTADRTAFKVFEPGFASRWPDLAFAGNVVLLPDPASLVTLPWAERTAWLRAEVRHADGRPVAVDPRRVLERATARLAERGWWLRCGLEVEFHLYRVEASGDRSRDPQAATWPCEPPPLSLVHGGYQLLSDAVLDAAREPLGIVRRTLEGLGLPLKSLEIELGPSQFEAVFEPMEALEAADAMIVLRNGLRQALARHGYLATFMCRPPFPQVMSSGWHLHQSLVETTTGRNRFACDAPPAGTGPDDALHTLSEVGAAWLAGLLAHAPGMAAACVSNVDGFERFRPNAMAPLSAVWGCDNRGAMLRVVGTPGDASTRIENRIATPAANPYLALATQIAAGLDGIDRGLAPPPATSSPYAEADNPTAALLPVALGDSLAALAADPVMAEAFGAPMLEVFLGLKRHEGQRHAESADPAGWMRREYLARL
jgi:glutamine synthetase